mmetsp:Transcript_41274/g.127191  ORF Transcript_41274/g.127191 Transcript_41274/m.127191 type:complete len:244 (+) Transcript_41274:413-1144(+)
MSTTSMTTATRWRSGSPRTTSRCAGRASGCAPTSRRARARRREASRGGAGGWLRRRSGSLARTCERRSTSTLRTSRASTTPSPAPPRSRCGPPSPPSCACSSTTATRTRPSTRSRRRTGPHISASPPPSRGGRGRSTAAAAWEATSPATPSDSTTSRFAAPVTWCPSSSRRPPTPSWRRGSQATSTSRTSRAASTRRPTLAAPAPSRCETAAAGAARAAPRCGWGDWCVRKAGVRDRNANSVY